MRPGAHRAPRGAIRAHVRWLLSFAGALLLLRYNLLESYRLYSGRGYSRATAGGLFAVLPLQYLPVEFGHGGGATANRFVVDGSSSIFHKPKSTVAASERARAASRLRRRDPVAPYLRDIKKRSASRKEFNDRVWKSNIIQHEHQTDGDMARRIEKLKQISATSRALDAGRARREARKQKGRSGRDVVGKSDVSDDEDESKGDINDDSTSSSLSSQNRPSLTRTRRRRSLLNATALKKMAEMKRQSREQFRLAARDTTPSTTRTREARRADRERSFGERVAREERLLSAREDEYRECAIMDEDEYGKEPHGKMCWESIVHIGMSLDMAYIQGATALINSIIKNASCPQHLFFHFMIATANARGAARESGSGSGFPDAKSVIAYYFPFLDYHMYEVDDHTLKKTIRSMGARSSDLENPLNYSRILLPLLLPSCVDKVIYLDTDMVVIGRIEALFDYEPGARVIGSPEFCGLEARTYFTDAFWEGRDVSLSADEQRQARHRDPEQVFGSGSASCYFNPGVLVIDVNEWKAQGISAKLLGWMAMHKESSEPLYELGSLPPFLLVFAGRIAPPLTPDGTAAGDEEERSAALSTSWNDHDYGCVCGNVPDARAVNIVHWSCAGKPWRRLGRESCVVDEVYYRKYALMMEDDVR